MGKIGLIVSREYLSRVKKKSFIIMTIAGPILMAALFVATIWLSMAQDGKQKIMVVDDLQLFHTLPNSENVGFEFIPLHLDSAKQLFQDSDYTAILYLPENILNTSSARLYFKKQPGYVAQKYIESRVESRIEDLKLKSSNLDKEAYTNIKTKISLANYTIKELGQEEESSQNAGLIGLFFAIMIYMFIFLYGVQVMRGVIEEKTSRIIEVIISSVKPFQLMLGKIIGVALVGLTQFLLWVILTATIVTGVQTYMFNNKFDTEQMVHPSQQSAEMLQDKMSYDGQPKIDANEAIAIFNSINFPYMLAMFLFYFLGGYLLYSAMFAAIGAAVDSESDTQQFMLPVTLPLIFAFIVAQFTIQNPEGPISTWFSIIPFTSPIVMMVRVASVPFDILALELIASMILLILGFLGTTWVAGKIYRTGILMYGKKINYKELGKWLFYKA
jgi:ABC-2 type transport system permease protein